ncbi:MAG: PEGA domain-containing protein [Treponema sp.]|jgi:hypothetical protein|nr:PEGA domain-containing protein [Treponema sp.]
MRFCPFRGVLPLLLSLVLGAWFFPAPLGAQNISDIVGDSFEEIQGRGLVIRTKPAGARVFIDGLERGETPLTLERLRSGEYHVRLVKEGYRERRFQIVLSASSRLLVSIELEEAVGQVLLRIRRSGESPPPEILPLDPAVFTDGGVTLRPGSGETPVISLPVGYRTIRVRAFGWEDAARTVFVEENRISSVEFILKPAAYTMDRGQVIRPRFNPVNPGSLGRTEFHFEVSAPGQGTVTVEDSAGWVVYTAPLGPFRTWSQSVVWDGRDPGGEPLPPGIYQARIETESLVRDAAPPQTYILRLETEIDASAHIYPLSLQGLTPGLLFAPVPAVLPTGSFQIETGLFFGKTSPQERAFSSLPFNAGIRFSPASRLELTANMNVLPNFDGDATPWGLAASAKWLFFRDAGGLPLDLAAGISYAWEMEDGTAPLGPGGGFGLTVPLSWRLKFLTILFGPGMRVPVPGLAIPRLLLSGGLLFQGPWFTGGFSLRPEFNFSEPPETESVRLFLGGELKLYPPPSNLVFSLSGGAWFAGSALGGFGGVGIGLLY